MMNEDIVKKTFRHCLLLVANNVVSELQPRAKPIHRNVTFSCI